MKRPHRRSHLLIWLVLAPITAIAAFLFWTMRPMTPYSELPENIEAATTLPEAQ